MIVRPKEADKISKNQIDQLYIFAKKVYVTLYWDLFEVLAEKILRKTARRNSHFLLAKFPISIKSTPSKVLLEFTYKKNK